MYGILFFNEIINLQWFFGFSMILIGIYLLTSVQLIDNNNDDDSETKGKKD